MSENTSHKRSARNLLIDPGFQLKYSGYLLAVALVLATGLGVVLYQTGEMVVEQGRSLAEEAQETARFGQATVDRGKEVVELSRKVNKVVAMNIEREYADSPDLARSFGTATQSDEAKLDAEHKALEADAARLVSRHASFVARSQQLEEGRVRITFGLVGSLLALVIGIGAAGIVMTHRIAGPMFKLRRVLREVGSGALGITVTLRRKDELREFSQAVDDMLKGLREQHTAELARVDAALVALADAAPDAAERELRELRDAMESRLGRRDTRV